MKKNLVYVETAAQLRALAAPTRQEICDCLATVGPVTVHELAEHLGRPADALYFHVRRLVKVGLIVELEPEKTGRHRTARFDLVARPLKLKYRRATKKQVEKVIGAATRAGLRDFEHAYEKLAEEQVEGRRDLWAGRAKGWLTLDDVSKINQLLSQIQEIIFQGQPDSGAGKNPRRLFGFTFLLSPSAPPFRERGKRK